MRGLFFNAQPTTDIVAHPSGYDREYDSDDFNRYMGVFFGNGVFVRNDPEACKVTALGLALAVAPGIALVDGGQCHFEPGDGLTITQGDGLYSVMCRRNAAAAVRAFELVVVRGEEAYPAPVRDGDIYDLCLAHVQVADGMATVTDTREERELCGFAALTGQPPYYPPDEANLPYVLWLYVLGLPMTPEQVEAVEGNPSLMEIFNQSRIVPASKEEAEAGEDNSKLMTPLRTREAIEAIYKVGDIETTVLPAPSEGWLPCNGATLSAADFPSLDLLAGGRFREPISGKVTPSVSQNNPPSGRTTRGTPHKFIFLSRLGSNGLAYVYDKNVGTTSQITLSTSMDIAYGYSGLIPVVGGENTLVVNFGRDAASGVIQVINPSAVISPAMPVTLPYSNVGIKRWSAYQKDENTIVTFVGLGNKILLRININTSTNSLSTESLTISALPTDNINTTWVNDVSVYVFISSGFKLYKAPRNFTNESDFVQVTCPEGTISYSDDLGNILFAIGGSSAPGTSYLMRSDDTAIGIWGLFNNSAEASYAGTHFFWDTEKDYGVFSLNQTPKVIKSFDRSGVLDSFSLANTETLNFSSNMACYATGTSPYTASLYRLYQDIRLPRVIDGNGKLFAIIKVR